MRRKAQEAEEAMRVIALIQEPKVIDKIVRHLRAKGRDARAGPWVTGPPPDGAHGRSDGRGHGGATALETRMGRLTRRWEGPRLPGCGGGAIEIPIPNGDGIVDGRDEVDVYTALGSAPGGQRWNARADPDLSGAVDAADVATASACLGGAPVPTDIPLV